MDISINYKPHDAQKQIHAACDDKLIRFITVNTSRQFGKTKLIMMQALKWALEKSNQMVWVVSPTDGQALKIMQSMIGPLLDSGMATQKSETQGNIFIKLITGSKIQFKSARSEDSLRGNTLDYLIIDEAAFIKESVFTTILLPMIITKPNSRVLICSTPKGRTNWFYGQFKKVGSIYKSFKFTYKDNPLVDLSIIEEFKKSLPTSIFKQEFEAEFVDSSILFSNLSECEIDTPTSSVKFYGGIDLGMKDDNTVFSVINEHGELVEQDCFTGLEVDDLIIRLVKTYKKYNFDKIYIEDNNFGLPIYQILKKLWFDKLKPFNTNSKTKPIIISNLISSFSQMKIKFMVNDELVDELCDFGYTINNTGSVSYSAISGKDDRVMSLSIAWECYNKRHLTNGVPIVF